MIEPGVVRQHGPDVERRLNDSESENREVGGPGQRRWVT
jgi:hypothetical protein